MVKHILKPIFMYEICVLIVILLKFRLREQFRLNQQWTS